MERDKPPRCLAHVPGRVPIMTKTGGDFKMKNLVYFFEITSSLLVLAATPFFVKKSSV
jgi:hypothetical protein